LPLKKRVFIGIKKSVSGGFVPEKIDYREEIERPVAVFDTNIGVFEAELYAIFKEMYNEI
jgi:hypothetical protein